VITRLPHLALLALSLLALPLAAEAQEARRPIRIGVLNAAFAASHPTVEGLKAGLKELGYEDGRHVTFDIRFTEGRLDTMPEAAGALVKAGVDLIFTSQEAATKAAREATASIPIVFTLVGDPVGAQLVRSLARPGGNVTGVSSLQTELMAKRLEVLRTLVPIGAPRLARLLRRRSEHHAHDQPRARGRPGHAARDRAARRARRRGARRRAPRRARDDAVLVPEGSNPDLVIAIIGRALALRLPSVFGTALWVGHGGLISYGPDYYAQGVQAASLVAKIVRGAAPQDLPVVGAEKIDLAVNLKTAEQLGVTVPRKILLRADAFRR
jgi:putative ABC transport system substrate-binding protein